jgi:hypothetical protein
VGRGAGDRGGRWYNCRAMTDDQPVAQPPRRLFLQPSPGYWNTKEKIKRIRRLQDLIRHRENWGGDIALAQPLKELLPDVAEDRRHLVLDQEITKGINVADTQRPLALPLCVKDLVSVTGQHYFFGTSRILNS